MAWRKGKRANGKNPNLAPTLFTSPAAGARRRGRRWSGGRAAKSQRIGIEGGGGELEGGRHTTLYEAPAGSKPLQHKACAHRIGEDPRCICCQNKIEYENPLSLGNRRSGGGEVISQSVGDLDSIPLPGCPRRAGEWPVPRGQAAELWASPDPASMEHGVLRLGGEWVASRKRHWPAWCWSSGAEVTMGSGGSDSLGVWESGLVAACRLGGCVMSASRLPDLAGNSYRSVTRSWPCCVWSFADWNRGFSCPTWQLVGFWKRVSRNRRFHQAPGRDPLPSPPSGGAVISTLSRALPARLIERPRLTVLGAAETCRLSLPGPIHGEELEGREGSGPRPRHASSHETDAPSPGAACPPSALALAVALFGKRIRRSSVLDNKQMSGHGAPMTWPGATSSAPRLWRGTGGGGAGLSRQDTLEAELQAIIEPWRPSKPRACAAGGATLDVPLARHRDQVASTIPLIPEITNGHRPARKEHVLRR